MIKFSTLTLGAVSLMALASACNVQVADSEELDVTGTSEEAACGNDGATNSAFAAMAADAALDMQRWLPDRDFVFNYTTGILGLSQWAYPKCPNRQCKRIEARLMYQQDHMAGTIVAGEALNPGVLRSRMWANWDAQMTCINRPDNNSGDNCPWQQHQLQFLGTSQGNCGLDYNFRAWVGNTTPAFTTPLAYPAQLKNMLIWAGHPSNPHLDFFAAGQDVRIDPPDEGGAGSTGSGAGSCQLLTQYSSGACQSVISSASNTRTIGACCKCGVNGVNKAWRWKPNTNYKFYECY
jgi:hypothetical protein